MSNILRAAALFSTLALAAFATGCAADTSDDGDDDEDVVESSEDALKSTPNEGWSGTHKTGAFVTCSDADLLVSPGGKRVVHALSKYNTTGEHDFSAGIAGKRRPVLVQEYPGAIKGQDGKAYVWIDPDFNGLGRYPSNATSAQKKDAQQELDDRFGKGKVSAKDIADGKLAGFRRRGWIERSCLEEAKAKLSSGIPTKPSSIDGFGNGQKVTGTYKKLTVLPDCLIGDKPRQTEFGYGSKKDPTSYWSYGAYLEGANAVYLSYNTPGAKPKGEKDYGGGGFTETWAEVGKPFYALEGSEVKDGNLTVRSGKNPTLHSYDGRWTYGYVKVPVEGGTKAFYGWIYSECVRGKN